MKKISIKMMPLSLFLTLTLFLTGCQTVFHSASTEYDIPDLKMKWAGSYQESDFSQEDIDSDTVQWFCSAYAIYTERNYKNLGVIGGIKENRVSEYAIKNALREGWNITDRDSAIEKINWLLDGGHRSSYHELILELKDNKWLDLSIGDYLKKVGNQNDAYRYIAAYHAYQAFGERGIDAWDYCRALQVLGDCYVAGYINLEECLDQSLLIAQYLQSEFESWQEIGQSYLLGYQYWQKSKSDYADMEYKCRKSIYEDFLKDTDGPYAVPYDTVLTDTWHS